MNQHYIEYVPGTVARVSEVPSVVPEQSELKGEVNRLSKIVVKFNEWLLNHRPRGPVQFRFDKLNQLFQTL